MKELVVVFSLMLVSSGTAWAVGFVYGRHYQELKCAPVLHNGWHKPRTETET